MEGIEEGAVAADVCMSLYRIKTITKQLAKYFAGKLLPHAIYQQRYKEEKYMRITRVLLYQSLGLLFLFFQSFN